MKIRCIDLFCGAGGLTCGLQKGGIKVSAGVDLDDTCRYAYEKNNHSIFICGDITKIDPSRLTKFYRNADVKILVGCAPCQPFSRLKKNKENSKKSKWGLLYAFLDKVKQLDPNIVSMENVPEIRKADVFFDFVAGLKELGYSVAYKVVNAADFGVPERRMRIILLASKYGHIELNQNINCGDRVTVRDAIGNLPKINAGEICPDDPMHRCRSLSPLNIERIIASKPGGSWEDWPLELRPKCYLKQSGKTYTAVYGRMRWDEVAPTLTTQFDVYGTGRYGHPDQNRALSLREGALLQSFPPNYDFIDPTKPVRESDIARQIGNAVPPNIGLAIAISIKEHLKIYGKR